MSGTHSTIEKQAFTIILAATMTLSLGGCSNDGPAVEARPQSITFAAPAAPAVDQSTATVSATASSGLAVRYSSLTPTVCTVDSTGTVTGISSGTCSIAADQAGNSHYAPAPQQTKNIDFTFSHSVSFAPPPVVNLYDRATVSATDSSGLPVSYSSTTPLLCSVTGSSGLVTALGTGSCSITATSGAVLSSQSFTIAAPAAAAAPGTPTAVTATSGDTSDTVLVHIGATTANGSPITGYAVTSIPPGISGSSPASPVTVNCPSTCAGYSFTVTATNATGTSAPSAPAEIITDYKIIETFYEPDTQPNNSIFVGTFTFNATTGTVTNLKGLLSESMTGGATGYPNDTMTWLPLAYQLSSVYDPALGGLLVTTFKNNATNTFFGGSGWTPADGVAAGGIYYGFPKPANNPGNAYAMIFVNTADPTKPLTQAQIDKLAYADCAPGGMMGAACMTGTTAAGYGAVGTMSGYPVSQVITRQ